MAKITLSRNLKLKISSDLTADAKYNLDRIDALAAIILPESSSDVAIRSIGNLSFQPNSADIGGTGVGGAISFGTTSQPLSSLSFNADSVSFSASLGLGDTATGGDKKLFLKYKSDLSGSVDTSADRNLNLDLQGADRNVILGSDLSILGPGNLHLTVPSTLNLTLPSGYGSSGQVLTTNGSGTLSWTSATSNALGGLSDVQLSTPEDGQTLVYDLGLTKWINRKTSYYTSWFPADGTTKVVSHNLGTLKVMVQILDESNNLIDLDVTNTSINTTTLTASDVPGGTWTVLINSLI